MALESMVFDDDGECEAAITELYARLAGAAGDDSTRTEHTRRAMRYIEANPHLDLTIDDIAGAVSVTPRALQLAFRRHLDTTPMAYLRRVRLVLADRELRAATPGDGVTITDVSYGWRFSSPSRFSQYYREAYGEPPSRTLRRPPRVGPAR